jgi:hypothetical protein
MNNHRQPSNGDYVFANSKEEAIADFQDIKFICEKSTVRKGDLSFTISAKINYQYLA